MENLNESDNALESGNSATEQANEETTSQSPWEGFAEEDSKFVGDKGWKTPSDMLKSYRELEKSYGNKISLPKDEDVESWNNLYSKLGKPTSADGYELEGVDDSIKASVQEILFKNNVLPKDVKGLIADYDNFIKAQHELMQKSIEEKSNQELEEVLEQWGDNKEKNTELAKRGAKLFGLSEEELTLMERSVGTKKFLSAMLKLGESISEDSIGTSTKTGTEEEALGLVEWFKQLK